MTTESESEIEITPIVCESFIHMMSTTTTTMVVTMATTMAVPMATTTSTTMVVYYERHACSHTATQI